MNCKTTISLFVICIGFFIGGCTKDHVELTGCLLTTETDIGSHGNQTITWLYAKGTLEKIEFVSSTGDVYFQQVRISSNGYIIQMKGGAGDTYDYTYDDNHNITGITTTSAEGVVTNDEQYTYSLAGKLSQIQTFIPMNGTLSANQHYVFHYAPSGSGNPIYVELYNDYGNGGLVSTESRVFDTHKAIANGGIAPPISENNLVKSITTDASGHVTNTTTYTYTYNSADLPATVSYHSVGTNANLQNGRSTYNYTCQ